MQRVTALLALAIALGAAASGCRPSYPACNNDDDCNQPDRPGQQGKPGQAAKGREFCVNQVCQKCRGDKDCPAGTRCNKGRCDAIPDYCEDDAGCAPDKTCKDHRCTACAGDNECGDGGKCRQGKCVRKGMCDADDDCPEGQDCKKGKCVAAAPVQAPQSALCPLQSVPFDFNESVLSTDATAAIDANYACIQKVGRMVRLIGRSDPRGTEEYNMALSERRAQQVKDRLNRLGMDGGKIRLLPKGELEATGKDESGWAQDRRVDFEWM